jgi:hypothetical protein
VFEAGNIIYFDPFFFKNGNTAKAKYFVILKTLENSSLIASLPTRKDSTPRNNSIDIGCIEIPELNFNCFVVPNSTVVTTCGKIFDFTTYLYGYLIDDYDINLLLEIYPNEGSDYSIWGKMKDDLFGQLIDCFKNLKAVKRKYKNLL